MSDTLIALVPSGPQASRSDLATIGFGLAVAGKLGGACDVLVLGPHGGAATNRPVQGVRRFFVADHPDLAHPTGEALAAAIAYVAKAGRYRLIGGVANTTARDSFPRVAARLGAPMVSDVVAFRSADPEKLCFTKPCFSGNLLAEVEAAGPTVVAACRPSAFEPPSASDAATIENAALPERLAHSRKKFVEAQRTELSRPELTEANTIVSGGRGTKGDFKLIEQLADLLGAAVGASRAVVDAGWMPNDFQVGQTGKVVAPKLYIACGLSGAIQHLAGMRNSKTIVAINKDSGAPIFEVADYGLVADLFEAIPQLIAAIQKGRK
ncbi:MAG: electron transfer flavoprotein subunit alpha/FixB family protein [Pirellulales bacterium]|nr:electron transfer flavoprotein subunit alpha/FixB family protein [Pirellulales bacterium]